MKIILFTRCAYLGNASCPVAVITIFIVAVILRSLSMDLRRPTAQLLGRNGVVHSCKPWCETREASDDRVSDCSK